MGGQSTTPDTGATGLGGNTYGRGGQAERDGAGGTINRGFGGVVIIAWPICTYPNIPPVPPVPVITKPNILSGSILTAWQWAPSYTASATTWSDSNIYNNTSQFRIGNTGTATTMSISGSSIEFNNNRMVYTTYPMTATPSSSFSLNVYGEFNSGSNVYPLFANSNSDDLGWDFSLYRSGSTPYIAYRTRYSPGPGASNGVFIATPLSNTNVFTGSNLLTINVNTNATTFTGSIDVYVNGLLNSSSISQSWVKTFTDGVGNCQFGLSSDFDNYFSLSNAAIKDTMIYNRALTQGEILSNYNALTSSI